MVLDVLYFAAWELAKIYQIKFLQVSDTMPDFQECLHEALVNV